MILGVSLPQVARIFINERRRDGEFYFLCFRSRFGCCTSRHGIVLLYDMWKEPSFLSSLHL